MKNILVRILVIGAFTSCLLTACGKNTVEEKTSANPVVTAVPADAAVPDEEADKTPIAMVIDESETPSGIKVEPKFQKYKVVRGANIRSDCDGSSEWKGSLFGAEILQGTGVCENGWIQVLYNGEQCYVTGGCLEETDEGEVITGAGTPAVTETPAAASVVREDEELPAETIPPEAVVKVSDWAKYTSSEWESDDDTSCYVQIYSVAGNQVSFRFTVIDGSLKDQDIPDTLAAEAVNCNGKIENGILNFNFTDSYGNAGAGNITIVDDTHLNISTMISQPATEAEYRAEIMTELTKKTD